MLHHLSYKKYSELGNLYCKKADSLFSRTSKGEMENNFLLGIVFSLGLMKTFWS